MTDRFKRPLESYNKFWLGTTALGVIAAVIAGVLMIGALDLDRAKYTAEFAQAVSLRPGEQVTVAGVSVGEVSRLELNGDRVLVTFMVNNDVHLGADTKAAIKLTTLLGSRYVELQPAGEGELEHRRIALASTEVPYNLQQTLADATTTFDAVDAGNIAQSLTALNAGLVGVPEALPQALTNLKSLASIIADRRDQLRTLLASTDSVTTLIRNQKANLSVLILQGRDLLGELTTRRAEVQRLFSSTTQLVATMHQVLADRPAVNEFLASTREFTHMIASHDAQLRNLLQVLPIPLRNIANMTGDGTGVSGTITNGPLVDSWMCAISGRAKQFNFVEYFQDCQ